MICRGVKDGGGDRVACDIMCPRYGGSRSNGQGVREKSQFPRFAWTQHQPVRPERDFVQVSVGRGVNDVEADQTRVPVRFEEDGMRARWRISDGVMRPG